MTERNRCLEIGCAGACCKNFYAVEDLERVLQVYPGAIETDYEGLPQPGEEIAGVYFTKLNMDVNKVLVRVEGWCPKFDKRKGECIGHENILSACENLKTGSLECQVKRGLIKKLPTR